jgi:hypothetical protein
VNRPRILHRFLALAAVTVVASASALAVASPASAHASKVKGSYDCDEATGNWVVTWTVGHTEEDIPATLIEVVLEPEGSTVTNIEEGATLEPGGVLTGVQVLPPEATGASLAVRAKWIRDGKEITDRNPGRDHVTFKDTCEKPTPPSPEPEPEPAKPSLGVEATCDKFTLTFANPEDGEDFDVTLTPSTGEAVTLEVAAGESETADFPASEDLTVEISAGGETATVAYEKPDNCDGGGGGLPVTGPAIGGIIGAAALLLAAGAALFLAARRRRVRFTI